MTGIEPPLLYRRRLKDKYERTVDKTLDARSTVAADVF